MIKKLYGVQESCPLFDGGKNKTIKYPLLTTKEQAEQYKDDLEIIDAERYTCCEYEIVEFEMSDNYIKDIDEFHKRYKDTEILSDVKGIDYLYGDEQEEDDDRI